MKCWKCNAEIGSADTNGLCGVCRGTVTFTGEVSLGMAPTLHFRWLKKHIPCYDSSGAVIGAAELSVLQQLWRDQGSAHEEWRDVPVEEE